MKYDFLLVGLGNIGQQYELTRHNFGFLLVDQIIDDYNFSLVAARKFDAEMFSGKIADKNVVVIKPQTFMNRSGIAVASMVNFYKIPLASIIVCHDDLDLELGRIKVKVGGGNGGHNGLKSIDSMVGKNYSRIRLGIGTAERDKFNTSNYVLGNFSTAQLQLVKNINTKISQLLPHILDNRFDLFLNKFTIER